MAETAETITEATFDTEVLGSEEPIIVDFWAEWCGPCHAVAPVLDEIVAEHEGIRLAKVNIDEEPALAQRFGILSIPAMVLFEGGEPKAAALGAQPKKALEKALGLTDSS
ncbi:MAG: thioredoxin [Gaiellaceae bacterium]